MYESITFGLRIIQSECNIIMIICGTLVTFRQSLKKEETSHQLTSMCIGTSASMEFRSARCVSHSILVHLQKATWYLNCKIILPCNNRMFSTLPSISILLLLVLMDQKNTTEWPSYTSLSDFPSRY